MTKRFIWFSIPAKQLLLRKITRGLQKYQSNQLDQMRMKFGQQTVLQILMENCFTMDQLDMIQMIK